MVFWPSHVDYVDFGSRVFFCLDRIFTKIDVNLCVSLYSPTALVLYVLLLLLMRLIIKKTLKEIYTFTKVCRLERASITKKPYQGIISCLITNFKLWTKIPNCRKPHLLDGAGMVKKPCHATAPFKRYLKPQIIVMIYWPLLAAWPWRQPRGRPPGSRPCPPAYGTFRSATPTSLVMSIAGCSWELFSWGVRRGQVEGEEWSCKRWVMVQLGMSLGPVRGEAWFRGEWGVVKWRVRSGHVRDESWSS